VIYACVSSTLPKRPIEAVIYSYYHKADEYSHNRDHGKEPIMTLPYQCPDCGTELGYKGLCWRCRTASNRRAALAWTPEEVAAIEKKEPECLRFPELLPLATEKEDE